jgi:two-component system alkaline phosphatase synthesis response regulator PhoP
LARILVAEDDPIIRHLLTQLLVDDGHEVAAVADGVLALEKIFEGLPDLLLLDLMMPRCDGFQVLEELRNVGLDSSLRVMILSARITEHDYARSLALGADCHMTKPFDPDELLATINELISMSDEELRERRDQEHDRAYLLSQLESIFTDD